MIIIELNRNLKSLDYQAIDYAHSYTLKHNYQALNTNVEIYYSIQDTWI